MDDVRRRQDEDDDEPFDPDRRELCSDGMCVGVIGKDGRCKVCGKPGSGGAPAGERPPDVDGASQGWRPGAVPAAEDEGAGAEAEPGEGNAAAGEAGPPDFERTRVPCSDDLCTGIIGRNGRCGTCGKPWSRSAG